MPRLNVLSRFVSFPHVAAAIASGRSAGTPAVAAAGSATAALASATTSDCASRSMRPTLSDPVRRCSGRSGGPLVDQHDDAVSDHLRIRELQRASLGRGLEGLLACP